VTLLGLISKHGILIVQFAMSCSVAGAARWTSIIEAASVPTAAISDDTAAMVLGVVPAGDCLRRRCGRAPLHGHRAVHRLVHRHPVYAAGGAAMYILLSADHGTKKAGRRVSPNVARSGALICHVNQDN